MSETPSYVSQPQVIDLPKLLADVRAGHIQVPRFQRPLYGETSAESSSYARSVLGFPSVVYWCGELRRLGFAALKPSRV